MKKIYILTAVSALLALSLNAQTQLKVDKDGVIVYPKTSTEQVEQGEKVVLPVGSNFRKAPLRDSAAPVTPPYTNDFSTTDLRNWWQVIDANDDGSTWTLSSNGYAQYTYNSYNDANDWLITAPVYLEAGKIYTFSIDARAYNADYPEYLEVRLADVNSKESLSQGKTIIPSTDIENTSFATLSNDRVRVNTTGKYYFGIHAISPADYYALYVDNLSIGLGGDPAHDLKAYVSSPLQVYAGQTATVTAKVTNMGDFAETGYTVKFYANGNEISSQTANELLTMGSSKIFTAQYNTSAADAGSTVNFTATVVCTGDADATNDNSAASMSVIAVPAPVNVVATDGDQSGSVTWNAPNISGRPVTEDFEDTEKFAPFDIGGITATQHTSAIGGWGLYDSTGAQVWGSTGEDFENEGLPQAWMVFNPVMIESLTAAHSGDQYMESVCPVTSAGVPADSWLISPELSGEEQTITFYERALTNRYGNETYEVWVSTTDNNISSFSRLKQFEDNNLSWTLQTAVLPAGTKYFAIRHTSNDIFGLLVEDITYKVAGEQPVSYNVYLDDNTQPVNVDANTFSNDFSNLAYGSHTCYISAVYAGNLESEKVPATFLSAAKTATPVITYDDTQKGYVTVTATGNGTVTLSVDGQTASSETGTVSIIVVRSPETRNVTATATAKEEDKSESDPATQNITIFALPTTSEASLEGLLRMHLVIVDQLEQEIPADNSHPDRYGYVLRYEPNGAGGEGTKESGTVDVKIQKTDCEVLGKYTLEEIDNDKEIGINHDEGLTMDIYSADVKFDLTDDNPDVDFYLLEKETKINPGFNYVTKLQQTTDFTYVEMLEGSGNDEYPAGPHIYEDEVLTGSLGDYVRYAPVVSTWGLTRRYFESDGKDNTYGAPLWKTGVGEVTMVGMPIAERQHNGWNTEWTDKEGTECSLYILDEVIARGTLPNDYSTVKYEPYMFRIFVESKNGNLRPYTYVPNSTNTGDQIVEGKGTTTGPICVWSGYVNDPKNNSEDTETPSINGVTFSINGNEITFEKDKVDRTGGSGNGNNNNGTWDKDSNNAIFGAVRSLTDNATISLDDLSVFVRFYYVVKGKAQGHTPWLTPTTLRGNRDGESGSDPVGYGAESDPGQSRSATAVTEINYHGEVVGQTYYNIQGMESEKPFDGVNIVVTRYSDGSTSVAKIVR